MMPTTGAVNHRATHRSMSRKHKIAIAAVPVWSGFSSRTPTSCHSTSGIDITTSTMPVLIAAVRPREPLRASPAAVRITSV